MANQRMTDFRKRNAKESELNYERQQGQINQLFQLILGMSGRLIQMEKRLAVLTPVARVADWRSLAMMKLIGERFADPIAENTFVPLNEAAIGAKAEALQIEHFERESFEDDKVRGLILADDETACDGHFAISMIKIFKNGNELQEERMPRTKVELGAHEIFPELDDAIRGMRVGEVKMFPLDIQGKTDAAEISLLGLRKPVPKEEPVAIVNTNEPVKADSSV